MDKKHFAARLTEALPQSGRTAPEFAAASQVSPERLTLLLAGTWAGGEPPTPQEMYGIAAVVGLSPSAVELWLTPGVSLADIERQQVLMARHETRKERRKQNKQG